MFFKALTFILGLAIGGAAYVHYSNGPLHQRFDPLLTGAVDTIKSWIKAPGVGA